MIALEKLKELKEQREAVILAHYYVDEEVQKIADYILFTYKDIRCDELRLLRAEIDRLFERGGQNTLN